MDSPAERARYDLHDAEPDDVGYAKFTAPLVAAVRDSCAPHARGLDFGAGRGLALALNLRALGYAVEVYDPFYWPDLRRLNDHYDFVTACEVIEHFFDPGAEFDRLRKLLQPGASLFVMTDPWRDQGEFHRWYYRRDPTHVSFYSARTFGWIADHFGFKTVDIRGRLIVLGS